MKTTSVSYCQACHKDFRDKDIVYYVIIDNSIVCGDCAAEAKAEIQARKYEKGGE